MVSQAFGCVGGQSDRCSAHYRHEQEQDALGPGVGIRRHAVSARGDDGVVEVRALTEQIDAAVVLACVGTAQAIDQALVIASPGSMIGYLVMSHGVRDYSYHNGHRFSSQSDHPFSKMDG